jgi:hypothetical protein
MTYRILVERVKGGWVANVYDSDPGSRCGWIALGSSTGRLRAIERAIQVARTVIVESDPSFVVEDLS